MLIHSCRSVFKGAGLTAVAFALVAAGCDRTTEEPARPQASASPGPAAAPQVATAPPERSAGSADDPDFIKYPPLHLKPACESTSREAEKVGDEPCVLVTLRCAELDPGESVWLISARQGAPVKLRDGGTSFRVTEDDTASTTVCCKPGAGRDGGSQKAELRLFTNEVTGAAQELACP